MKSNNSILLVRHATLYLEINGVKLLVDPMLAQKGEMDPVQDCGNDWRIPMTDLPFDRHELDRLTNETDAVLVTHIHRDHWDVAAQDLISKDTVIFCQPADELKIKAQGFNNVIPIERSTNWNGIMISRTGGQHGTGMIGEKMGKVSGFVLDDSRHSIYIAGDTIWCGELEKALEEFKPAVTLLNAGGARFLVGDPITMTPADIIKVHQKLPATKIIAVHMDTVNHCFVTRADLVKELAHAGLQEEILIPADGEKIEFCELLPEPPIGFF